MCIRCQKGKNTSAKLCPADQTVSVQTCFNSFQRSQPVKDSNPLQWGEIEHMHEAAVDFVKGESDKTFPSASALVAGMKFHKFYKDVTYETLKNKEFGERVMNEIPQSVLDGALLQEGVAVNAGM